MSLLINSCWHISPYDYLTFQKPTLTIHDFMKSPLLSFEKYHPPQCTLLDLLIFLYPFFLSFLDYVIMRYQPGDVDVPKGSKSRFSSESVSCPSAAPSMPRALTAACVLSIPSSVATSHLYADLPLDSQLPTCHLHLEVSNTLQTPHVQNEVHSSPHKAGSLSQPVNTLKP